MNAQTSHVDYHQHIRDTVHDPSFYRCSLCGRSVENGEPCLNSAEGNTGDAAGPPDENAFATPDSP